VAQVVWTESARHDLKDIVEYISRDSHAYARSFALQLSERVTRLEAFPDSGQVIPEDPEGVVRHLVVGNYRVLYRRTTTEVYVLAVVHGARDLGHIS
jgi:plasmid stabilization system protein ParE